MDYEGKIVAVTGGARGIGRAIAGAFHNEGARVGIADLEGAEEAASALGGYGARVDVTDEAQVAQFIAETEMRLGPIDVYVSNAGVLCTDEPNWEAAGADDAAWRVSFEVNVMGAVRGARHVWPRMRERGGGVFVVVASAAGLLTMTGATPYAATKHAAVSFAESLAIAHGDEGLQVVCVCPQGVRTAMMGDSKDGGVAGMDGVVEPVDVAREMLTAIRDKRFLALPHANVSEYETARAAERDRWLGGMRKLRRGFMAARGRPF